MFSVSLFYDFVRFISYNSIYRRHFEEKKQLVNQSEVVSAQKLYQEQIDNKAHAAELGLPRFRYFSVWFGFKVPITLEYF